MPRTYKGLGKYIIKGYALVILLLLASGLANRFFGALEGLLAICVLVFIFVALGVWLIMDARSIKPAQFYRDRKWRG